MTIVSNCNFVCENDFIFSFRENQCCACKCLRLNVYFNTLANNTFKDDSSILKSEVQFSIHNSQTSEQIINIYTLEVYVYSLLYRNTYHC